MPLDVRSDHLKIIQDILQHHIPYHQVIAFGSRVKGTARDTSDLDLCILGEKPLDLHTLSALRDAFSLSMIPYKIDVVDWASLEPPFQKIIAEQKVYLGHSERER